MGLSMKEKRNVIAAYRYRYTNAGRKEKPSHSGRTAVYRRV
jgi:hypothetical protein